LGTRVNLPILYSGCSFLFGPVLHEAFVAASTPGFDRLLGQIVAERYHIKEVLGEGGMGRVYLAEHVRMGRRSAVKVLSPRLALSADAITRFNREAANAARINHPNVVQIYDFGETSDGILYLAMEFVEGETLRSIIQRTGPLAPARAAALTEQVADALAAAHHLGIVHRDLKPDNIMVGRRHDGGEWVKVVDFGISKTVQGGDDCGAGSQTLTTAGVSLGTPEYMSPEQLAGERLDSRTDLYSLGVVVFNMLTANLPYPGLTSRETLVRRLTSRPKTLADVAPQVAWPPALQAPLDRALAPNAADRHASVSDFASDVVRGVMAFDAKANRRFFRRTARLSGATVRIANPPAASRSKGSAWRAPLIAAGAVLLAAGAADAGYIAYRYRLPDRVPASEAAPPPLVTPSDTTLVALAAVPQPAPDTAVHQVPPIDTVPAAKPQPVPVAAKAIAAATPVAPASTPSTPSTNPAPPAEPVTKSQGDTVVTTPAQPASPSAAAAGPGAAAGSVAAASPAAVEGAADADRVRLLTEEIRGHAIKANELMARGDVPHVRSELRDVADETQTFRMLFAAAADSIHLQQLVRAAGMRVFQTCQTASADTTIRLPSNFTCQQLIQPPKDERRARFAGQRWFGRSPD
jgi:hypothetical protein